MKKEITIPREWFERLNNMYKHYADSQGAEKTDYLNVLLGYLASVETILEIK